MKSDLNTHCVSIINVQSNHMGKEKCTEEEISMLWKRSSASDCLERNCLIVVVTQSSLLRLHATSNVVRVEERHEWKKIGTSSLDADMRHSFNWEMHYSVLALCQNIMTSSFSIRTIDCKNSTKRQNMGAYCPPKSWKDSTLHWRRSSATPYEKCRAASSASQSTERFLTTSPENC